MLSTTAVKQNVKHAIIDLKQMKSFCEKPLIITHANGIYITDIDGKRYIDGISGIYVVNIGHGNEYVIESIRKQLEKVCFVAPLHAISDTAVEYTTRLAEIMPEGLNTMKILSGGSEATENAIKFARQYHRQTGNHFKYKVISLYKGYHGATLGAMSASGLAGPRKSVFGPFLEGFVRVPPPSCFHCPYGSNYPSCNTLCADMVDKSIEWEGPESVAAVILEPIGNTGGIVTPPQEFLSKVREACDKHNVLLIFDEIITGMGRTGSWFAAQTFGVTPDLLCAGKGLSSGYSPLSAIGIKDDLYYSAFWGEDEENIQFASGHTFGGNPVSCAAGLAVIDVVEKENLIENGRKIGDHLRNRLKRETERLGVFGDIRGKGCLVCVEFVENMETKKPFPAQRNVGKKLEKRMLDAGLILRCDPNWIAFAPPLITTIEQADEMVDVFTMCLAEELRNGDLRA